MARKIPIEQIVTDRSLREGDDVSSLAKSIDTYGLQVPVLVDSEYNLIDGLRRLEAIRSLGLTEVTVTATSMYPVACDVLNRAREHGVEAVPLTARRVYEISTALKPVLYATVNHYKIGRRRGSNAKGSAGGRALLAKSLGFHSESPLQAMLQVFYAAEHPETPKGQRALEAIKLLEEGKLSTYGAVGYISDKQGLNGKIKRYADQKATLEAAITSLKGTMRALNDLGPLDDKFPVEEAEPLFKELAKLRGSFYKFVRNLDEEIQQNEQ